MGTIRLVLLDGLTVADLLALRQGGFFEGATMALPAGVVGQEATLRPVAPVTPAAPATISAAGGPITPEQRELLTQIKQDVTTYQEATGTLPLPSAPLPELAQVVTPVAEVQPVAEPQQTGPVSIASLAGCTKLRDVLQLLIESGMPAADLTAYLEGVREQVPLLQRISNIGERVARTLSVMGQGG